MPNKTINELLKDAFDAKHADAAVKHFREMVGDYQQSEWADATAKGGKFIEAVIKALWVWVGETVPVGKDFSVGGIIDKLERKPTSPPIPESIKLLIPRACRFAYEVASNRGARHDPSEIDANEMDASTVVSVCSWVLAEMVRFSQHGHDLSVAKAKVDSLMRRRYPFMEEIDGRVYSNISDGALGVALRILFYVYPERMSSTELVASLKRHSFSHANAVKAVQRLAPFVDNDGAGNVCLRSTGLQRVDELLESHRSQP